MEQPLVTVRSSLLDDVLLVEVVGEVDLDTVPDIRTALSAPAPAVVLDLAAVTFFGSAGIQLLVDADREIEALAVVASTRLVLRPLVVTGLDVRLPLCASPDAALERVRGVRRGWARSPAEPR
ncbi:STAS domain-containing protein [Actinosynnema sp. NPDC023587]|uniref:STAS domain-containing protein n=1 Tax=Actinosynnema sp. NPDC023587 TaxID=3154695 RepID=UPI0033E4F3D1